MPRDLYSSAKAWHHADRKAFEPEYVANIGDGTDPAKEPRLRINPFFLQVELESEDRLRGCEMN